MADTLTKPKLQLRSTISINGNSDKSPSSPATKLLINHGKPNFTINKSPKTPTQNDNPLSPEINSVNNNNNKNWKNLNTNGYTNGNSDEFIVKSTKFNGVFKPSNITVETKQPHQTQTQSEVAKVTLRRAKVTELPMEEGEDASVPEFIRRQRRIQERLAKENILDFENRRSGYFTQVMISPTLPNRTSFVETMSSPAIVPALEIPPPQPKQQEELKSEQDAIENGHVDAPVAVTAQTIEEEDEVNKAIEEVYKAIEAEDDEKESEHIEEAPIEQEALITPASIAHLEEATTTNAVENAEEIVQEEMVVAVTTNGHVEDTHKSEDDATDQITISHTNGHTQDGPCIPAPDPSGALGVNFEQKTVVSFSKDLGSDVNKYPDTVKIVKDGDEKEMNNSDTNTLDELAKLKFEIKGGEHDVEVTPVLRTEN